VIKWGVPEDFRTPGQLIRSLLEERGWDQRLLAVVLGVEETRISKLISGMKAVDAETAIALSEVFEIDPERLLDLQKSYDLAKARIAFRPDRGRANRALLFGQLPISEMIHRGWLDTENIRDIPQVEAALASFFGVRSPEEIEILPHAAKKTDTATPVTPAQLVWIYRVKQIAREMLVPPYSRSGALNAIEKLNHLLLSAEEARNAPRILAEVGIRFVIVESLKSAKIDGVCCWLDDTSPVIGMSLRFDRIDNFWFVLRHELEHVMRGHGRDKDVLDSELEVDRAGTGHVVSDEERVANEAAAEFCVPSASIEQFIARKAPIFAERDLLGFARTLRIHPGLVAGQLQRRTQRYELFRKHLVKIRSIIAPNAMVDGWGDVAPTGA
jgi:HTH-type transcriptional regulator/antitoxin HigA